MQEAQRIANAITLGRKETDMKKVKGYMKMRNKNGALLTTDQVRKVKRLQQKQEMLRWEYSVARALANATLADVDIPKKHALRAYSDLLDVKAELIKNTKRLTTYCEKLGVCPVHFR